jgi:ActR/RegA family two-component response regulator
MTRLIITADDELYERLACRTQEEGDKPHRAANVLDGFRLATTQPIDMIVVDMSLHAADTLVETLHSRAATAGIPLYVVHSGGRLPFELRRLCTDILEADTL